MTEETRELLEETLTKRAVELDHSTIGTDSSKLSLEELMKVTELLDKHNESMAKIALEERKFKFDKRDKIVGRVLNTLGNIGKFVGGIALTIITTYEAAKLSENGCMPINQAFRDTIGKGEKMLDDIHTKNI